MTTTESLFFHRTLDICAGSHSHEALPSIAVIIIIIIIIIIINPFTLPFPAALSVRASVRLPPVRLQEYVCLSVPKIVRTQDRYGFAHLA